MNRADLLKSASLSCGAFVLADAAPSSAAPPVSAADAQLDALLAQDWADRQRRHPEAASYEGEHAYDDRWDDPSEAAAADEAAHQRDVLARLQRIDRGQLSEQGRTNADLYSARLHDALQGYDLRTHLLALNQRGGVQTDVTIVDNLRFATLHDYEQWTTRIERWPAKVDATIVVLREAVARKMLWPRVVMERIPAQIDRQLVPPEQHPFFRPFVTIPSTVPPADAARLRNRARAAIATGVLPALHRLREFFTATYLPAAPTEVGLMHVPGGAELYAYLARVNVTTAVDPDAVHALGLQEVARIRAAMESVAPRTGYHGSLQDVFRQMREDPKNYHPDAQSLLAGYCVLAKRIDPELVRFFRVLPRQPYGVTPIPDAIAPDATTAYYQPGALDGSRAGSYCVNLYRPDQRPIYEMPVLTLHESVPGHHLQFALAVELGTMPAFRRAAYYVGYSEGWGLYAESLGEAIGVYDDAKTTLGALSYEMWRAVRLVVDTGMHAKGWSRQRAIDFFLANAAKTRLDIENEIDRYITDPGQALAYKLGQLKLLALRDRAKERLGARFDLRDYHQVVLGSGSIPLDALERRVDAWLTETRTVTS